MATDFLLDLLQNHAATGANTNAGWWDETRIPLASIDKRVTELLDLTGKKAIVTGGAGLNLGQACVNRLAGLGADVAVVDLRPDAPVQYATPPDAEGIAKQAAGKWGTNVFAVYGDVMDWSGVQRVMHECHERLGRIDILVNNASAADLADFAELSPEQLDHTVRGAFLGPLYCSRAALDYMIPQGSGRIINVGSEAGLSAMPLLTLYGSCKAALNAFTKFLGKEVAKHGIQVLGVNPGCMWGPNRELPPDSPWSLYPMGRTAIQRFQLPEEVANMIAFLASDAASCMTGAMVDMGGGMAI